MKFFTIFQGQPGADRIAVTINLDHVVKVIHHGDNVTVHMSDGVTHSVAPDNIKEFRMLLEQLSEADTTTSKL